MIFQGNWVDLLILFSLLFFFANGIRQGFISRILELAGFVISLTGALLLFGKINPFFEQYFSIPSSFSPALGFLTVWFVIESAYFFTARRVFGKLPTVVLQSIWNRGSGWIPAILNGLVLWAFLLTFIVALPVSGKIKADVFGSEIGSYLVKITSRLEQPIASVFRPAVSDIQKSLTFLTITPKSRQRVDLNFSQPNFSVDLESELEMLKLVNFERTKRSLGVLVPDDQLREVAREHSADMFKRGYFSHFSPNGENVADRLAVAGIDYLDAGENLAYAPDVELAHDGLMESAGHRRNILAAEFGKIGIGVIDGGVYGKMFTQVFTN